mgnify:CR=1 FL=1
MAVAFYYIYLYIALWGLLDIPHKQLMVRNTKKHWMEMKTNKIINKKCNVYDLKSREKTAVIFVYIYIEM